MLLKRIKRFLDFLGLFRRYFRHLGGDMKKTFLAIAALLVIGCGSTTKDPSNFFGLPILGEWSWHIVGTVNYMTLEKGGKVKGLDTTWEIEGNSMRLEDNSATMVFFGDQRDHECIEGNVVFLGDIDPNVKGREIPALLCKE